MQYHLVAFSVNFWDGRTGYLGWKMGVGYFVGNLICDALALMAHARVMLCAFSWHLTVGNDLEPLRRDGRVALWLFVPIVPAIVLWG